MNPWLINLVKDANERMLSVQEVERVIAFLDGLPARIKLGEDLERLEPEIVNALVKELPAAHPGRPGYTRVAIQDVVESLRHLFVSVFVDEPEFLRLRWTDNLAATLRESELDEEWAADIYRAADEKLRKLLRGTSLELYRPAMDQMMESVSASAVAV